VTGPVAFDTGDGEPVVRPPVDNRRCTRVGRVGYDEAGCEFLGQAGGEGNNLLAGSGDLDGATTDRPPAEQGQPVKLRHVHTLLRYEIRR